MFRRSRHPADERAAPPPTTPASLFAPLVQQHDPGVEVLPDLLLFHVHTHHGTQLLFSRADGTIHHGDPAGGDAGRVAACIPATRPDICLLVAAEDGASLLRLDGDPDAEPAISLRAVPLGDTAWSLSHPVTGLLLCAEPGRVAAPTRETRGIWETFQLVPTPHVSAGSLDRLRAIARRLPALASVRAALQAIRDAGDGRELRPLLRTLRPSEVEWLGRRLLRDLPACKAMARLYPGDIWARLALPDLAASAMVVREPAGPEPLAPAPPGFVREIDTSLDVLAALDREGRWRSFPQACSIFARRDRDPSRTVCLLTTVRDEGIYLIEWLAYHRLLGVEGFFVYSNDLGDGSDELLRILAECGILSWTSNVTGPGLSPQYKAYGHALQVMPEILDFRWAGFIDLDEFVVLNADLYRSIPAFLAVRETAEVDAVVLNWVPFGSNGELRRRPAPVLERFTTREPAVNPHIKAFLRPHRFTHATPHHPHPDHSVDPVFRNASGEEHPIEPFSPVPQDGHAFIAHYHSKSAEEHLLRRSMSRADVMRGTDVSPARFERQVAESFLYQRAQVGVPDDRAARHLPAVREEMARLQALPGVQAVLARIEARYQERLRRLAGMMADDPRFQQPGTAERWFADLLQG